MVILDNIIYQNIERTKARGIKLGILKKEDKDINISEILYIDMVWRTLNIGHDLDTDENNFEIQHKKMLQYGNLNKILATYEQIRNKKEAGKTEEGLFAKIVKKYSAESKAEDEKRKKKFEMIAAKVAAGEVLTEEEQIIFDAGTEAAEA